MMKIIEKIQAKQNDINGAKPITIAFIGDSVTQGCFDVYFNRDGKGEAFCDYKLAYSTRVRELLNMLYPKVQINIINSGISGDTSAGCLKRLQRDVLDYNPDLVVVSVGLNEVWVQNQRVERYAQNLKEIFTAVVNSKAECIYMTQNSFNTTISPFVLKGYEEAAQKLADFQKNGDLTALYEAGKKVAKECGVIICDVYEKWLKMIEGGVNVTEILVNKLNHPIPELHYLFAYSLIEKMFGL